jgi:hypothetical protein
LSQSDQNLQKTPAVTLQAGVARSGRAPARNLYDVSPDGQRFLFMTPVADDRLSPFTILLNWRPDRKK